mgnify:CR=1 FL=1
MNEENKDIKAMILSLTDEELKEEMKQTYEEIRRAEQSYQEWNSYLNMLMQEGWRRAGEEEVAKEREDDYCRACVYYRRQNNVHCSLKQKPILIKSNKSNQTCIGCFNFTHKE